MTLPVSSASNEILFSLKLIKTYLRLTMGDNLLNDLLVISVEAKIAIKIDSEEVLDVFASMKNCRYPFNA